MEAQKKGYITQPVSFGKLIGEDCMQVDWIIKNEKDKAK